MSLSFHHHFAFLSATPLLQIRTAMELRLAPHFVSGPRGPQSHLAAACTLPWGPPDHSLMTTGFLFKLFRSTVVSSANYTTAIFPRHFLQQNNFAVFNLCHDHPSRLSPIFGSLCLFTFALSDTFNAQKQSSVTNYFSQTLSTWIPRKRMGTGSSS